MKKVTFVIVVISLLAGVLIIPPGKLQSQNAQTGEEVQRNQLEKLVRPRASVKVNLDLTSRPNDFACSR